MTALPINSNVGQTKTLRQAKVDGRLRVLHLITSFDIGGTERQAIELLNRIDESRFDVRVGVLHRRGALLERLSPRFSALSEFPLTSFYNANAVRQLRRLRDQLIHDRIAILHTHDFYAGMLGVTAARLAKVKVIAAQRHLRLSERLIHEWGTRYIQKLAHRVLVNSEAIRDHIMAADSVPESKVVVIRNGVFAEALSSRIRDEYRTLLCRKLSLPLSTKLIGIVARLEPVKGHRYLIEAAAQVIKSEPHAHFVLIGDGTLREEIEQQTAQLGITHHVHLLGDRNDAAKLAAAFDVSVLASLHEGLPNAVMEAMAVAVPVVATAVGGVKEMIKDGETGFLVPPANSELMARRILDALRQREISELIALRGRQYLLNYFSMQRMVESTENLYREMLVKAR